MIIIINNIFNINIIINLSSEEAARKTLARPFWLYIFNFSYYASHQDQSVQIIFAL